MRSIPGSYRKFPKGHPAFTRRKPEKLEESWDQRVDFSRLEDVTEDPDPVKRNEAWIPTGGEEADEKDRDKRENSGEK